MTSFWVPSLFVCRNYDVGETELAGTGQQRHLTEVRAMIAWLARDTNAATLTEAGKRFDRDVGAMSFALRRLEQRAEGTPVIRERMNRLKAELEEELATLGV
jgi:chromosomal replication initiation ATPase DnaA